LYNRKREVFEVAITQAETDEVKVGIESFTKSRILD